MKNKKKTYVIVGLLIAIITLGVGYAAVAQLLTINGNATALHVGADVIFDSTTAPTTSGGQTGTAAAIDSSDTGHHTATCTVVLKNLNEQATCTYTIKNNSSDTALNATSITATPYQSDGTTAWTSSSSQYFTVEPSVTKTTLTNNETTTVTVTVTLKKVNVTGTDISETFVVKVSADTEQAS